MREGICTAPAADKTIAASVVKTIILAALLRWHEQAGTPLSAGEKAEARAMITESDNNGGLRTAPPRT